MKMYASTNHVNSELLLIAVCLKEFIEHIVTTGRGILDK